MNCWFDEKGVILVNSTSEREGRERRESEKGEREGRESEGYQSNQEIIQKKDYQHTFSLQVHVHPKWLY
jgi:hypothetical protein